VPDEQEAGGVVGEADPVGSRRWSDAWHRLGRRTVLRATAVPASISIVVATADDTSVTQLLASLAIACAAGDPEIVVVDDRSDACAPLAFAGDLAPRVVRSGGGGRSVARNVGLREATSDWVVLLDDDLVVGTSWYADLLADLGRAGRAVAGVAARAGGPTAGSARLGADVAYRRLVALSLGGYQDRFPRASCHDDVELVQRMSRAGWGVVAGSRCCASVPLPAGRAATGGTPGSPLPPDVC
jgi:hypothetical protein